MKTNTFDQFEPIEYIQISIANAYGLDKLTWRDRLTWFYMNEDNLDGLVHKAEEPAMFTAAIEAYQRGDLDFPISLDSTASGIQCYSVLTGDIKAAKLCNVINTGKREDAYTVLYDVFKDLVGPTNIHTRDDVKKAIMTSFYGSQATPKRIFGEGKELDVFYHILQDHAPKCWQLRNLGLNLWDPTKDTYKWTMPDNFHVEFHSEVSVQEQFTFMDFPKKVTRKVIAPKSGGRAIPANIAHATDSLIVRELVRRCSWKKTNLLDIPTRTSDADKRMVQVLWNHYELSGFLSARILQHLGEDMLDYVDEDRIVELIDTLPNESFDVLPIHDCFRSKSYYGNYLRNQYNQLLKEIADSNLLSYMISGLTGIKIDNVINQLNTHNPELIKEIPNANYALS